MLQPTVYDEAQRTVAGGWGTSTSGHLWVVSNAGDSSAAVDALGNGYLTHAVSGRNIRRSTVGPDVADFDVRAQVGVDAFATGALLGGALIGRHTSSNNYYFFRCDFNTDQVLGWEIRKTVAGVESAVSAGLVGNPASQVAGGRYWIRAKATGTLLQVKVWSDAVGEPVDWTGTATDSSLAAAGKVGIRSELPTANTNALPVTFTWSFFTSGPYINVAGAPLAYSLEAAWGADLAADPATWQYTDLANLLSLPDPSGAVIRLTPGTSDEASQTVPTHLSATLENLTGNLTPDNPNSTFWPNVILGTPIRSRVAYSIVRFLGQISSLEPRWDANAGIPTVALGADGALRRVGQGDRPLRSPLERAIVSEAPLAYWPMEDRTASTSIASALKGCPAMTAAGLTFATNTAIPGSAPLPEFSATGTVTGLITRQSVGAHWQLDWHYFMPGDPGVDTVIMRLHTTGTVSRWDVVILNGGTTFSILGYDVANTLQINRSFASTTDIPVNGTWIRWALYAKQNGGSVDWGFFHIGSLAHAGVADGGTLVATLGNLLRVYIPPSAGLNGFSTGHIAVLDDYFNLNPPNLAAAAGYAGETATARIARLCGEQGVPVTITGTSTTTMDVQPIDTFISMMRECELADDGLLYDGISVGLRYLTREARYNLTAAITLDASQEQTTGPLVPRKDDQRIRNDVTATRSAGSSARYVNDDADDPMSTVRAGVYDPELPLRLYRDADLLDQAGWSVHKGTTPGMRYPSIGFDLTLWPELAAYWLDGDAGVGCRLDVTDLPSQHTPGDLSQVVGGYVEEYGDYAYQVTAATAPYNPWRVIVLAADSGDTDPNLCHLDTDDSALNATITNSATSVAVKTNSGPLWGTTADDFPFDLDIDGERVTVTNITGAASPQTFTVTRSVNGVVKAHNADTRVRVWNPPVLAL